MASARDRARIALDYAVSHLGLANKRPELVLDAPCRHAAYSPAKNQIKISAAVLRFGKSGIESTVFHEAVHAWQHVAGLMMAEAVGERACEKIADGRRFKGCARVYAWKIFWQDPDTRKQSVFLKVVACYEERGRPNRKVFFKLRSGTQGLGAALDRHPFADSDDEFDKFIRAYRSLPWEKHADATAAALFVSFVKESWDRRLKAWLGLLRSS